MSSPLDSFWSWLLGSHDSRHDHVLQQLSSFPYHDRELELYNSPPGPSKRLFALKNEQMRPYPLLFPIKSAILAHECFSFSLSIVTYVKQERKGRTHLL